MYLQTCNLKTDTYITL